MMGSAPRSHASTGRRVRREPGHYEEIVEDNLAMKVKNKVLEDRFE